MEVLEDGTAAGGGEKKDLRSPTAQSVPVMMLKRGTAEERLRLEGALAA